MFKANFIRLCNKHGVAPTVVCQSIGLTGTAFSKWTDESVPRRSTLVRIAEYFDVSVESLTGNEPSGKGVRIPVFGSVAAGIPIEAITDIEDYEEITEALAATGEAKSPGVDLIRRIIHALGGSFTEIFAESNAVIGGQNLEALQADVNRLSAENTQLSNNLTLATLELSVYKDKVATLEKEKEILLLKLECAEKLNAVHNFYNNIKVQ